MPICSAQAVNFVHAFFISQPAIQITSGIRHLQEFQDGQPTHLPQIFQQWEFQSKNPTQTKIINHNKYIISYLHHIMYAD